MKSSKRFALTMPALALVAVLGLAGCAGLTAQEKGTLTGAAVGGVVGMIGGLGGFVMPIAFGMLLDFTGLWTSYFMLLFVVVGVSLLWMHTAILRMER